jgi:hypothetical protein
MDANGQQNQIMRYPLNRSTNHDIIIITGTGSCSVRTRFVLCQEEA